MSTIGQQSDSRIEGTIHRVMVHGREDHYVVARIRRTDNGQLVTVTGRIPGIATGQRIIANGHWVDHRRYGRQFQAATFQLAPPNDREGIIKYLSSGAIPNVGKKFAEKLVSHFGDRLFDVLENSPSQLRRIPGIGPRRAGDIVNAFQKNKQLHEIMAFLHSHQIGTARAHLIYKRYKANAISMITQNPYRLMNDIPGFGFKTCDRIAQSLGIKAENPSRIRAGLLYRMDYQSRLGHCAVPQDMLITETGEMLGIDAGAVAMVLEMLVRDSQLISEAASDPCLIFLPDLYQAEIRIRDGIGRLRNAKLSAPKNLATDVNTIEASLGIRLSASQKTAVITALQSPVAVITGGPGVGKTTTVRTLLACLRDQGLKVALCAPTGRAAKRLSDSSAHPASTIHRLLGYDGRQRRFARNRAYPLEYDALIADEMSMTDVRLFAALMDALPEGCRLYLVGDTDQLPSVGPGAVFSDLIASGTLPVCRLTEIFRQSEGSAIINAAHAVNRGRLPRANDDDIVIELYPSPTALQDAVIDWVVNRLPNDGFDPVDEVQVLTAMHLGECGTETLNHLLQARLNPNTGSRIEHSRGYLGIGDKVMQISNDHEQEIYNGDIGRICGLRHNPASVDVKFQEKRVRYSCADFSNLRLAYATTIHKAQGTEQKAIVLVLPLAHYRLLDKSLIYTAITRAKEKVVILSELRNHRSALDLGIRRKGAISRLTTLATRLRENLAT